MGQNDNIEAGAVRLGPTSATVTGAQPSKPKEFLYPEWLTIVTRGLLAVFSTVTLAVSIWALVQWRNDVNYQGFLAPIFACAGSILVNYAAAILSVFHKYGPGGYWLWVVFFDPLIGGIAILGFALGMQQEGPIVDGEPWKGSTEAVRYMILVVGIAHILANVGGFYGIHVVSKRKQAADAAEEAREREMSD